MKILSSGAGNFSNSYFEKNDSFSFDFFHVYWFSWARIEVEGWIRGLRVEYTILAVKGFQIWIRFNLQIINLHFCFCPNAFVFSQLVIFFHAHKISFNVSISLISSRSCFRNFHLITLEKFLSWFSLLWMKNQGQFKICRRNSCKNSKII